MLSYIPHGGVLSTFIGPNKCETVNLFKTSLLLKNDLLFKYLLTCGRFISISNHVLIHPIVTENRF